MSLNLASRPRLRAGAAALFILFLGCGRQVADAPLVLAVGGVPAELEAWSRLLADFTAATGQKVELLRQPADSDQRRQGLVVALQARRPDPDVFLMDVAWIAQFAASEWLSPLDEMEFPAGAFDSGVLAADRHGGRLLALPVYVDGGLLYYRRDLLEQYGFAGPPETWEELETMARKAQAGERRHNPAFQGYVWQGAQYEGLVCNFLEVAASAGGGLEADGRMRVDSEENARALAFMRGLVAPGGISPPETYSSMREEEARLYFQRGDALFARNWPYAWPLHQEEGSPVRGKVGIASLPSFPGQEPAATLGGWHVGISRFTDAPEAAHILALHLASVPVQKRLALELGWNPGRREVYEDPEVLAKFPHFRELRAVFEHALPRPGLPYYSRVSEVLQRHLNSALAGKSVPKDALRVAQEEIAALTARYGGR